MCISVLMVMGRNSCCSAALATSKSQWIPAWATSITTPSRAHDLRPDSVALVQDTLWIAVEHMGRDIPRTQDIQDAGQWDGRAADVNHELHAGLVGGLPSPLQRSLSLPVGHRADEHAHLHAHQEAGVLFDGFGGQIGIGKAYVLELAAKHWIQDLSHGAYVQERQQTHLACRKNVVPHGPVVCPPRATGVHAGGDPRRQAAFVGAGAIYDPSVIEAAVKVDHTGGHQLAGHIDRRRRLYPCGH